MRLPFAGTYPQTQGFGENPEDYKRFNLMGHNGLDFGTPTGTPILAPHKGTVKEASFDPLGYGWYLKIENETEGSILAHLDTGSISVKVGDFVDEGQVVAKSDNTGNSTGPHLHWGYYRFPRDRQNGFNGYVDQTEYLKAAPIFVPSALESMQPMHQIIVDCYRALCGEQPSEDEIDYRLRTQQINTYDLIREICSGDERFQRVWISPKLANKTDTATISLIFASLTQFISSLKDKFIPKKTDE